MAGLDTSIVLELSEFDISFDKLESKYQREFSKKTLAEINEILRLVDPDPQTAIDRLINLLEKNPDNPILKNHLSAAYSRAGQHEKAELVAIDNYEKYPDYLFAKTNYAQICIWHGKINKIPAIFEHNFNLRSLYPKRKTFHISEVMSFMEIMSIYFYKIGENKTAMRYYDLMKQLDKNHPVSKQTKRIVKPPFPLRILRKLLSPKDKIR